jgi:hypothetical protein
MIFHYLVHLQTLAGIAEESVPSTTSRHPLSQAVRTGPARNLRASG